jgi:hypothetical protein
MLSDVSSPSWHCFPEQGPPDAVIAGMRMLLGLPRGAQNNLFHLIRLGLLEPDASEHRQLLETYAMRFEANPAHVVGAVRACQFMLQKAAARRVDQEGFVADLVQLSAGNRAAVELLGPHYVRVRDQLRVQLLEDTLADHGNVLVGFDYRIDSVGASNHGEFEDVPVVFLNLAYRNGDDTKRLSLQLSPSAIASLQEFWQRFETACEPARQRSEQPCA